MHGYITEHVILQVLLCYGSFCFAYLSKLNNLFFHRNRVKAPTREVDTGAGFFIEEGGETEKIETQIVHKEGNMSHDMTKPTK